MDTMNQFLRTYVNTSSAFFDAHKKHPIVEMCKVTLSVLALRADIQRTSKSASTGANYHKRHPFATWFSAFLTAYAGSILSCFLMGESVLKPFCNPSSLAYVTAAWYAVFYSPYDLLHRVVRMFPLHSVLLVCAEIYRVGNIQTGVRYAMRSAVAKDVRLKQVLMVLVGTSKGCGGSLMRAVIRLVRSGTFHRRRSDNDDNEFQTPSFFTKVSFIASALFTAYWLGVLPKQFDYAMLNVSVHFFVISQRLLINVAPEAKGAGDPFSQIENFLCLILFGKPTTSFEEDTGSPTSNKDSSTVDNDDDDDDAANDDDDDAIGEDGDGIRRRGKKEE